MNPLINSNSTDGVNESPLNNNTEISSDNIETDYNNTNNENIYNLVNNISQIIDTQPTSDPYTQLFEDNPNNPFFKCKIDPLNYETDNEEDENFLRILIIWNYEFNYDYFHIINNKVFITKNESFFSMLNEITSYRNLNINNTTGIIEKIENNNFKINEIVHLYLIVYYDNAKCNIEVYGIFNQELEEEKLIKNIIDENKFGNKGKIMNTTHITSTGGDGFLLIHNIVSIE